jgi:hypothetical protein
MQAAHCIYAYYWNDKLLFVAGVVAKFTGAHGVIGMHGGLPPPDAFPFATLGGELVPEPATTTARATAAPAGLCPASKAAGEADVPQEQFLRLEITQPSLVGLAQQYIMTPKVSMLAHLA